ncbi:hypothetical protein AB0127_27365, partial [Klebsiella pneumoniae]
MRALRVGEWIDITGHPELERHPPHEREFIVTRLEFHAENNLPASLDERLRRATPHRESGLAGLAGLQRRCREQGLRYLNHFA